MTKGNKIALVDSLAAEFKEASTIAVCNYKGTSVRNLEQLRNAARPLGVRVKVIKNTLARIALSRAGCPELELTENSIFAWSQDQINLSKVLCRFRDDNSGTFGIKCGLFDGTVVDSDHITEISKLPNREELMGMLLSVWMGPARYFVTGLDNLRKQKEGV